MSPRIRRGEASPDLFAHRFSTPVGDMISIVDSSGALRRLLFDAGRAPLSREDWRWDAARNTDVERQLGEYFQRRREVFELRLAPAGSRFEQRVWRQLLQIPYGGTTTYGELAERLGDPRAVRAVGRANGANPIAIVIPCHRVIGADGSLVGYGGGLAVKQALLELEGALPPESAQARLF